MSEALAHLRRTEEELNRVIRGKQEVVHQLLTALISGGHILLEDVPGVGKTTLAKSLARLISADFRRVQFTPDLLPADILGTSVFHPNDGEFHFRPGPVFTNILLADEINRASPRTQSALLECMNEQQVSLDGECRKLQTPFMVIATENPVESRGTYPLPEAQLDRFTMRLSLGYPGLEAERQMLEERRTEDPAETLTPVLTGEELCELQQQAAALPMENSVTDYLLALVRATREEPRLTLGASPRAALVLARTARAAALLDNRAFVLPEDVRSFAPYVLCHRLAVDSASLYAGTDAHTVLEEIIGKTKMPR